MDSSQLDYAISEPCVCIYDLEPVDALISEINNYVGYRFGDVQLQANLGRIIYAHFQYLANPAVRNVALPSNQILSQFIETQEAEMLSNYIHDYLLCAFSFLQDPDIVILDMKYPTESRVDFLYAYLLDQKHEV